MLQVDEEMKPACGADGFAPKLTALEAQVGFVHRDSRIMPAALCGVLTCMRALAW